MQTTAGSSAMQKENCNATLGQYQKSALCHLRRKQSLVARDPDSTNGPVPFGVLEVSERPAARRDLLPCGGSLDVVELEQVDVIGPKRGERRLQFRRGVGGGSRSELGTHDDGRPVGAE